MKVEVVYNKIEVHNAAVYLYDRNPAVRENGDTVETLEQKIVDHIRRAVEMHEHGNDPMLVETYGYVVMVSESHWCGRLYFSAEVLVNTAFRDELMKGSETLWVEKNDGLAIPA